MKKGFTLIELIAVITIMSLIVVTVVPTIMNQLSNKKSEISGASKEIIYAASRRYTEDNPDSYPISVGNVFCITLESLANSGIIESPIKDAASGDTISLNRIVRVTVNSYLDKEYELLNEDETCTQSIQ